MASDARRAPPGRRRPTTGPNDPLGRRGGRERHAEAQDAERAEQHAGRASGRLNTGDAFATATEVLLLSLMNNDSSRSVRPRRRGAAGRRTMPPGSQLPSYRELQQRYRLSPATVQRLLADLTRRGLVVTRPGSGTFTAERRASPRRRRRLLADPGPGQPAGPRRRPGAAGRAAAVRGHRAGQRVPRRAAAAAGPAGRRRVPGGPAAAGLEPAAAQGLPELRSHFAAETGGLTRRARAHHARRPGRAVGGVPAPVRRPATRSSSSRPPTSGALAAARAAGLALVPVPGDADGVLPDALADALARTGARLVYLQPRYANPAGSVLAPRTAAARCWPRRRAGAFLLEDDWMRDFDLGAAVAAAADQHGRRRPRDLPALGVQAGGRRAAGGRAGRARPGAGPAAPGPDQRRPVRRPDPAADRAGRADRARLAPAPGRRSAGCCASAATPSSLAIRERLPDCRLDLDPGRRRAPVAAAARPVRRRGGRLRPRPRAGVLVTAGRACFPGEPPGSYLRLSFAAEEPPALRRGIDLLAEIIAAT